MITYIVGDNYAYANNRIIQLKILPIIKNGVTYIPLRFVAEAFDANVLWNGTTKTVMIRSLENNINKSSIAELRKAMLLPQPCIDKSVGTKCIEDKSEFLHYAIDYDMKDIITITNISGHDISLTNFSLGLVSDLGEKTYKFSAGITLPAGQNVRVSDKNSMNTDLIWNEVDLSKDRNPNLGRNALFLMNAKVETLVRYEF